MGFQRLNHIQFKLPVVGTFLIITLLSYFPTPTFPPTIKQAVARAENLQTVQILPAQLPFAVQLPHPGYLSTRFSKFHPGIDLATGYGMPIHPIGEGVVTGANFSFWGYGNNVIVTHAGGYKSLYAHMAKIYVKAGQQINPSTILGAVGLTGHTSGPHTHLEIIKDNIYLDPLTLLPPVQDFPSSEYFKPVGGNVDSFKEKDQPLSKSLKPDFN